MLNQIAGEMLDCLFYWLLAVLSVFRQPFVNRILYRKIHRIDGGLLSVALVLPVYHPFHRFSTCSNAGVLWRAVTNLEFIVLVGLTLTG
jgi:hypothetical protein